jgi:hypothetical protein
MRVFISSLISGMETIRASASEAVTTLRNEPVMAEDFGAQPNSPQIACLKGLRQADLVALILGEHYGAIQPSGLSATHEEYREAKGKKPVIAFVQDGISPDPQQAAFIKEVQGWEGGLFRGSFTAPSDLKIALTRALYDYALTTAVGPVDQEDLVRRAELFLPKERRGFSSSNATLNLAVAGGPRQSVLRPIEIENPVLADAIHQEALFGANRVFDPSAGVARELEDETLVLKQERGTQIAVNEEGSVFISIPVRESSRTMPELVHEFVQSQCAIALGFATWLLDHIDPTQRLSHVAVAVSLMNADHMGWRSQRESEAEPNRISLGASGSGNRLPVHVNRPRAALRLGAANLVEDLIVPLRRQWR